VNTFYFLSCKGASGKKTINIIWT